MDEAVFVITADDVRTGCQVLRPVYQATGGLDGRVSIEVDPRLARDSAATATAAKALRQVVDQPNLLVKIPATREDLAAITETIGAGISVNVTLIFSRPACSATTSSRWTGVTSVRGAGAAGGRRGLSRPRSPTPSRAASSSFTRVHRDGGRPLSR